MTTVLVIGAHPDDEVLGAGGTMAKHEAAGDEVHVLIVTEGSTEQYEQSMIENKKEFARDCGDVLGVSSVRFGDLPDMRLDDVPHVEVNAVVEGAVSDIEPDIVYTHSPHEVNRDHREVYESTMVATRPKSGVRRVLTYEVPSSTNWVGSDRQQFTPNHYVDISETIGRKIIGFEKYRSELREFPHPRSPESVRATARSRGSAAGFEAAEAFRSIKEYRSEL